MTVTEFFMTKYSLSSGVIKKIKGKRVGDGLVRTEGIYSYLNERKGECHEDMDDAMMNADSMRVKKIASLEKQIAKLKVMTFRVENHE